MSDEQPIDLDDLKRVSVKVREMTDDNWLADMVEIAHDEIARLRDERRWVPVGERLPTHRRPVIANCPSAYGPTEATYHHGKWHDFAGWLEHPVTEWKEMPPGPEGEKPELPTD